MNPTTLPHRRKRRTCGHTKHVAGCESCRAYARTGWHERQQALNNGEPLTVDAAPVREHVLTVLRGEYGMTNKQIIARAGIAEGTFAALLYSREGRPPSRRLRTDTAAALLGVKPPPPRQARPRDMVDATATRRTLQGLQYMGHRLTDIAARGVVCRNWLGAVASGRVEQVSRAFADAVQVRARALSATPGTCPQAARKARRLGWVGLGAWDDDTIGDPNAQPFGDTADQVDTVADPVGFDETTVAQAVEQRLTYAQIAHREPDLVETVRRLALTMTDTDLAHYLRWPGAGVIVRGERTKTRGQQAVCDFRGKHGIPAYQPPAAVVPEWLAKRPSTRGRQRPQLGNGRRTYARQVA